MGGFCFWRGAHSVDANVNSVPMLEFSREGPRILDALERGGGTNVWEGPLHV